MNIKYIALTLFLIMNFTNTQIEFIGLKRRIRRFKIRRFLKNTRIYNLYEDLKRKLGGGLLSVNGPEIEDELDQLEKELEELENEEEQEEREEEEEDEN